MSLDRRAFLVGSAQLLGGVLLLHGCRGADPETLAIDLARLLPPESRAVGELVREHAPGDAAALAQGLVTTWGAEVRDAKAAGKKLSEQIAAEHRAGNVVVAKAWRLARSEARLYALVAQLDSA